MVLLGWFSCSYGNVIMFGITFMSDCCLFFWRYPYFFSWICILHAHSYRSNPDSYCLYFCCLILFSTVNEFIIFAVCTDNLGSTKVFVSWNLLPNNSTAFLLHDNPSINVEDKVSDLSCKLQNLSQKASKGGAMPCGPGVTHSTCGSCCGGWYLQHCPGFCSLAREVTLTATLHASIPYSHCCAGIPWGTGRVWNWEYAVPFANVGVGVKAMGIPYSQTMICGMKARVFQLKIKESAWWINLLHQESGDAANCFCRIDCFENTLKQANKQKQIKKNNHCHPLKPPKYQFGMQCSWEDKNI